MNDESPFRISSMLLTVACLVCGICAAVMLVPRYMQRTRSVDHTTAASQLQLNLSEFHSNQPYSAPEQDQSPPPTRRKSLPVSSAIPLKKSVESTVASAAYSESQRFGEAGSVQRVSRNLVESTVIDRHSQRWTSPGSSAPQFYAPVTVHPVTVNIDNSGIIREISRVNERLDSLAAEKSQIENDVMARIEVGDSRLRKIPTSTTAVEVSEQAPIPNVIPKHKTHSNNESTVKSADSGATVHAAAAVTALGLSVEEFQSPEPQRRVERLKTIEAPAKVNREPVPAPLRKPVQTIPPKLAPAPVPVVEPVCEAPVEFHAAKFDAAEVHASEVHAAEVHAAEVHAAEVHAAEVHAAEVRAAEVRAAEVRAAEVRAAEVRAAEVLAAQVQVHVAPEPTFEVESPPVPEVPLFELPLGDSEIAEPQVVPEFEFSAELFSVPATVPDGPEIVSSSEFQAESVSSASPVSDIDAASQFETVIETVATTTHVTPVTLQSAELPELPALTPPGSDGAKRTTKPPFMNGFVARRSASPSEIANRTPSKIQRVSHTAATAKPSATRANPACHDCADAKEKSNYKSRAVTPPSPLERLRSLFK